MSLGLDRRAAGVDAEDPDVAVVGRQKPRDQAQGRRLSGAVWAEQSVEFAGSDREVEPIDRRPAEALGEAAEDKGGNVEGRHRSNLGR